MSSALSVVADTDGDTKVTADFSVQGRVEPGIMPRVLELFAKRGLVPQRWHSVAASSDGASAGAPVLTIEIRIAGIEPATAGYVARCMRQIPGVDTVLTTIE